MKTRETQHMSLRTVVVVAVGAVTSQGDTAKALWDGVRAGHVAIDPVEHLPMSDYNTRIGGEVRSPVAPSPIADEVDGFRDRAFDFAFAAATEAMEAAGALVAEVAPHDRAIVLGTCNAGLLSTLEWLGDDGVGAGTPELAMFGPPQAIAESLAAHFQCAGPVFSVNTACAAGANAIGYAADLIALGRADMVLAGGTDALSDVAYAGFNSLGSLSPTPAAPYQDKRTGLSLGEGSGMLVLTSADLAAAAEVEPLCVIRGYGLSADGYHPTAPRPDGTGAARAIRSAIEWAGLRDSDVGYVNSHGTGTPRNDSAEAKATRLALGDAADTVPVSSSKSMIGHLLGAAGAVEAIITVGALRNGVLPPTANLVRADPECVLDHIPVTPRVSQIDHAISNNFAFAGANASVVFSERAAEPTRVERSRVVVTGTGAVGAAGLDVRAALRAVTEGRDCTQVHDGVRLGLIDTDPSDHLTRREARRMDRLGLLSTFAASRALAEAGADLIADDPDRVGVVFGTGLGPMEAMEQFVRPLRAEGVAAANPAVFPNTVYNAAAGSVATLLGALGPTSTVTSGHAAGANALCYGYDMVSLGRATAILATAADTLTPLVVRGYRRLGLPMGPHDTFALAEGGAAVMLERYDNAVRRGATVYAEVLGHATASDARGVGRTDPTGSAVERAMRAALDAAGLTPGDIAEVWTNEVGLPAFDEPENQALHRLFGDNAPRRIAAKRALGEQLGTGGLLAAALAACDRPDRGVALVNSSSLGGTHISIVLAPLTD
ncbi:beta-ketoacyl-[acyl-carrier-protein] synthase family protein [Nocardia ignorata]|uniref:3-oxoacyl-[acyl-carrier-protein] synthase II n=1 Tax=Nocardia ignorata TaxID=145285 RepID=A0A4R6PSX5_NOCIG|nr:beta-ketoacyl-[acyl-carrier-protein] synthase family protein [Nocardia ignorata]TDP41622.1 3-oxoacyl-[acyl-carrier-protein] synthase II [Nocardia ignorata]